MADLQRSRLLTRASFFALFLLAPPLDLFRFDLTQGHAILLGAPWVIGIDDFIAGTHSKGQIALNLFLRLLLPLMGAAVLFIAVAYRWGRVYCGWLCPYFSVVETLNALMQRTIGKHSVWDRRTLPERRPDGRVIRPRRAFWPFTLLAALSFAFLWAVALLTYLLPPAEIYANLWHGRFTPNQARFIGVATVLLFVEFTLARHLFCRYGCAVGLFQSLAWMANRQALVVGFDTARAQACASCDRACENACPMRLAPRSLKRSMYTCTQCGQCVRACDAVQAGDPGKGLLRWAEGIDALAKSDPGRRRPSPASAERRDPAAGRTHWKEDGACARRAS